MGISHACSVEPSTGAEHYHRAHRYALELHVCSEILAYELGAAAAALEHRARWWGAGVRNTDYAVCAEINRIRATEF